MLRQAKCKDCGTTEKKLSHKNICMDCAIVRIKKVGMQIKRKKGKHYKKYKEAMLKFLS